MASPPGIRTPVATVKGLCPRPLDDGDAAETYRKVVEPYRDQTDDLLHAMQALSQLSYGPTSEGREFCGRRPAKSNPRDLCDRRDFLHFTIIEFSYPSENT